jgi:hypothetical protein
VKHPLARRLPLLVLVLGGAWWFKSTSVPERELVWRLEGAGWSAIRSVDVQVRDAQGELLKRETHSFTSAPPPELSVKADLASGDYEVWVFARGASGPSLPPRVDRLVLGDEDVRVVHDLRAPVNR